jgi:hypothetical protein
MNRAQRRCAQSKRQAQDLNEGIKHLSTSGPMNITIVPTMTGKAAPVHLRLTPKKTPDIDLILTFIAKNGVTKPTTAQERRYARKEQRVRGLLKASEPSAYRFRPGSAAYNHRSALMSEGFTLDVRFLPLEKLTGEYAEKPEKPEKPAPAPREPIKGYCAHCHKPLPRRSRTDAQYCSDAHRKAAARRAAKIAEANKAFKAGLSIAVNSHKAAELSGEYSYFAAFMNRETQQRGIGASFLATPCGVLITDDASGAVMLALSLRASVEMGRWDWDNPAVPDRSLTEHNSRDPRVIEMIDAAVIELTKIACEPEMLGGSIIKREEQKRYKEDCAAIVFRLNGLLSGLERKVWILTWSRSFGYGTQSVEELVSGLIRR